MMLVIITNLFRFPSTFTPTTTGTCVYTINKVFISIKTDDFTKMAFSIWGLEGLYT